jgi:hypothetical protein
MLQNRFPQCTLITSGSLDESESMTYQDCEINPDSLTYAVISRKDPSRLTYNLPVRITTIPMILSEFKTYILTVSMPISALSNNADD